MGSSRPRFRNQETYVPTPAAVPGATDVSSGETQESTRAREMIRQRKKRGVASTYRADMGGGMAGGKTRLGD
ncbi:MAG: hypothetical protein ACOYD9_07420 [Pyramidobacter sp.]|jgi:hypothetical protein